MTPSRRFLFTLIPLNVAQSPLAKVSEINLHLLFLTKMFTFVSYYCYITEKLINHLFIT